MTDLGRLSLLVELADSDLLRQSDALGKNAGTRLAAAFDREFTKGINASITNASNLISKNFAQSIKGVTNQLGKENILRLKLDAKQAEIGLKNLNQRKAELAREKILRLKLEARQAELKLKNLQREKDNLAKLQQIQFRADVAEAQRKLRELENEKKRLESEQAIKLKMDAGQARQELDKFRQSAFGVHAALKAVFGGFFSSIGGAIRRSLTDAVGNSVGFIGDSINKAVNFSGALNSFKVFSGATTEEVKALADEAKRLGIETSKTPTEAAQAAIEITKLGFSASQTKEQLAGVIALSESTGLNNISKAASIAGTAYTTFGIDAKRAADVISATANSTAANAYDMQQAFSKAGGVFKQNGQSVETLATAFGLLRNAGFEAQTSATALKTTMLRLAAPSNVAKDALNRLKISIYDSNGQVKNFLQLIPEFREKLANMAPKESNALVKTIFGDRGAPAFLALMQQSDEKISEVFNKIQNSSGVAGQSAKSLMGGLSGAMTFFQGSFETFQTGLGEALAPGLEAIITTATKILNDLLKGDIFANVKTSMEGFKKYLDESPQIAEALINVFKNLASIITDNLTTGIQQFTAYLSENPTAVQDFAQSLSDIAVKISEMAVLAAEFVKGFGAGLIEVTNFFKPIITFIDKLTGANGATKSLAESFGKIAAYAIPITLLINAFGALAGVVTIVSTLVSAFGAIAGLLGSGAILGAIGAIGALIAPILPIIAAIAATIAGIVILVKNWDNILLAIRKTWDAFIGLLDSIFGGIVRTVTQSDLFKKVWDFISNIIKNIPIVKLITYIVDAVSKSEIFKNLWNSVSGMFKGIGDAIYNFVVKPILDAKNALAGFLGMGQNAQFEQQGGATGSGVAGGAVGSGLYTGPSQNIGNSAAYHLDVKMARSLGIDKMVELFDQMAAGYRAQGRKIEFSNEAVAGEVYDETADKAVRKALLQRALSAHHSQDRDKAAGVSSVDFYIPKREDNRFGKSVEGAEALIPNVPGANVNYGSSGGYGNYLTMTDSSGNLIMKMGHGDNRKSLPGNKTLSGSGAGDGIMAAGNAAASFAVNPLAGQQYIPRGGTISSAERVKADPNGAAAMVQAAQRLGLPPDQFAALMSWESGGSLNPNIKGGDGNQYKGLIQFSPENQQKYGTGGQQSIAQQIPAVEKYLLDRGFKPGVHDIRGAYSAVLAGQADEKYWDLKDSNGTSVRNAAGKFKSGEHYERGKQFLQDSGINLGNMTASGRPAATGGMRSPVDAQGNLIPSETTEDMLKVDDSAAKALAEARRNEDEQTRTKREQAKRDAQLKREQETLAIQEKIAGITDPGAKESLNNRLKELSTGSQYDDRLLEARQAREDLVTARNRKQQDLKSDDTQVVAAAEKLPDYSAAIKSYDSVIAKLEQLKAKALDINEIEVETADRVKANAQAREARNQQQEQAYNNQMQALELQKQQLELEGGNNQAAIKGIELQQKRLTLQYETNKAAQTESDKLQDLIQEREKYAAILKAGGRETDPQLKRMDGEIKLVEDRIRSLNETAKTRSKMIDAEEVRNARELAQALQEAAISKAKYTSGVIGESTKATANLLMNTGKGSDTKKGQKMLEDLAVEEQRVKHRERILELEKQIAAVAGTENAFSADEIDRIRTSLENLNAVELQGIRDQFNQTKSVVTELGNSIQSSLSSALKSFIDGSKTAGEAFKSFIDDMLSKLLDLAINSIFTSIFGGGGLGGLFGGLFGGGGGGGLLGGIFYDGNLPNFARGGNLITKAFSRERSQSGANPMLAVVNDREIILSAKQSKRFMELGLDRLVQVPNFAAGNLPPVTGTADGGTTINIPVNINMSGEGGKPNEKPQLDVPALTEKIRNVVVSEIQRQKRGGELSNFR